MVPPEPMRLVFWGTRGSVPTPGPDTQRYGGNTACVEVRVAGQLIILDSGSGIRPLGNALLKEFAGKPIEGHLFISHNHWDHIQGFPFFAPFYFPQNSFHIYGIHGATLSFEEALNVQMSPTHFPVALGDMAARRTIVQLEGPVQIGPVRVLHHYVNHPGMAAGYRIESGGWTISYIADHEPFGKLNAAGGFSAREDAEIADFVKGSELLICDAQYSEEEYKTKKGWGHSVSSDTVALAVRAGVKRLALFHHDPGHSDADLDRMVDDCREKIRGEGLRLECFAAQEGLVLTPP